MSEELAVGKLLQEWPHKPYGFCPATTPCGHTQYLLHALRPGHASDSEWTHLRGSDGAAEELIKLQQLPWDSEVLGMPVARIAHWIHGEPGGADLLLTAVAEACRRGVRYLWGRVPAADVGAQRLLSANGFELIDGLITFGSPTSRSVAAGSAVECGPFRADEVAALEAMAARSFRVGRFHDPQLAPHTASAAYGRWLRDSCAGFADCVLVARDGEPAGFTTVKIDKDSESTLGVKVAVVGLVATSQAHRRRGIAQSLAAATLDWCRSAGCGWVEVGTQIANVPACRVYEAAGYRIVGSSLTYRKLL